MGNNKLLDFSHCNNNVCLTEHMAQNRGQILSLCCTFNKASRIYYLIVWFIEIEFNLISNAFFITYVYNIHVHAVVLISVLRNPF